MAPEYRTSRIVGCALVLERIVERADTAFQRRSSARGSDAALAWTLLVPALVILSAFGLLPLGYAAVLSAYRQRPGSDEFVGWLNYGEALSSRAFWDSVSVTFYYVLGTVPLTIIAGFVVANFLFRIPRFAGTYRTLFFLPYVSSVVAAATIWRVLLDPTAGPISRVTGLLGVPAQTWLLEPRGVLHLITNGWVPPDLGPSLALCCIILFEIWHAVGFMIIVFLAALTAVPRELEDAARLDGAGSLQVTWQITLPMLSPTIFFLTVIGVIGSFQAFSSIYALTGNGRGPLDTTQNLTVYIYSNFYEYGRLGFGSAVAVLLCLMLVLLTIVQWRTAGRRVFYQ